MKKITALFFAFIVSLLMIGSAFATECFNVRGSAVFNGSFIHYKTGAVNSGFYLYLTNFSGSDVRCRVKILDNDGLDITSLHSKVVTGSTNSTKLFDTLDSGTGAFDIPAFGTRAFLFNPESSTLSKIFSGIIEWTSDDPGIRKVLLANIRATQHTASGANIVTSLNVNGGQLF